MAMAIYKKDVVEVIKAVEKHCKTQEWCQRCELNRLCSMRVSRISNSDIDEVANALIKLVEGGEENGDRTLSEKPVSKT